MLAPPPGFSQLATSFLAWLHLGIPRALLPRLVCPCYPRNDSHTTQQARSRMPTLNVLLT